MKNYEIFAHEFSEELGKVLAILIIVKRKKYGSIRISSDNGKFIKSSHPDKLFELFRKKRIKPVERTLQLDSFIKKYLLHFNDESELFNHWTKSLWQELQAISKTSNNEIKEKIIVAK